MALHKNYHILEQASIDCSIVTYSVSIATRDTKTKSRMLDFLSNSYRSWPDVLDDEDESSFFGPGSVEGKATHIGFEYDNHVSPERAYNYAVLRWMALRVGRKRKQFQEADFEHSVPYYVFGGPKGLIPFPVVPATHGAVPHVYQDFRVDRYGLLQSDRTARELAWRNIPQGTFERVSITHAKQSSKDIREALVQSGIERAKIILQFIRAEVSRLDALWAD